MHNYHANTILSSCVGACRDPQDFEEGEIRAVDQDMRRRHAAHWGHNLALYRALGGQAPGALTALQAALCTADGSRYVCLIALITYLSLRLRIT